MTWRRETNPESEYSANEPIESSVLHCPQSSSWPTHTPERSEQYTPEEYKRLWEEKNCRPMTISELETLARGCIGITAVELGQASGLPNPDLTHSYSTFERAKEVANSMAAECNKSGSEPMIFSKRFYSSGKSYLPDPKTGRVDMSIYDYKPKEGFTNFDYGFYDESSNSWWHANHKEPGMKLYRSTLEHYSRPLADFDQQIFVVACGKH